MDISRPKSMVTMYRIRSSVGVCDMYRPRSRMGVCHMYRPRSRVGVSHVFDGSVHVPYIKLQS